MGKALALILLSAISTSAQLKAVVSSHPVSGGSSPTVVSVTTCFKGGSTSSATCNIGTATVGQQVWAAAGTDPSGAGGSLAITDNCNTGGTSNTYTALTGSPIGGQPLAVYGWSTIGATTSNCTITITETTTTGDFAIAAGLVAGGTTVEQSAAQYQTSPGTATDAMTSTATSATSHNDLVIGWTLNIQNNGSATPTQGTGYSIQQTSAAGPIATESLTQTSPGAATATFTTTTAGSGGSAFTGVICFH